MLIIAKKILYLLGCMKNLDSQHRKPNYNSKPSVFFRIFFLSAFYIVAVSITVFGLVFNHKNF